MYYAQQGFMLLRKQCDEIEIDNANLSLDQKNNCNHYA